MTGDDVEYNCRERKGKQGNLASVRESEGCLEKRGEGQSKKVEGGEAEEVGFWW